ncbi:hypothetical protein CFP56_031996 [Quercus suber]|uniref:Vesicle transport protein n=1 Tax=Quercus suber TaxID=58331 RepID=A0AAW0JJ75_QUESU
MSLRKVYDTFLKFIVKYKCLVAVLSIFDPKAAASARAQLDGVDEVDREAHGEADVPGDDLDLEAQAQPPGLEANEQRKKDWNNAMLAFCMASSMAIALLPVQLHSQLQSSLPCLALALLLGFTSFFLSVFIHAKFVVAVRVLQKCGQFFTVTAFFLAISLRYMGFEDLNGALDMFGETPEDVGLGL